MIGNTAFLSAYKQMHLGFASSCIHSFSHKDLTRPLLFRRTQPFQIGMILLRKPLFACLLKNAFFLFFFSFFEGCFSKFTVISKILRLFSFLSTIFAFFVMSVSFSSYPTFPNRYDFITQAFVC